MTLRLAGRHPRDELQLLLDGRIEGAERVALERHLAGCVRCQRELESLRWLSDRLAPGEGAVPAGLEARIRAALDVEDAAAQRRTPNPWRWAAVAAAAVLAVLAALYLVADEEPDLATLAAAHLRAIEDGTLPLEHATNDPGTLEAWYDTTEVGFHVTVYDLAMMDLRLLGGRVVRFAGGPGALYAYRMPDGSIVICEMYRGKLAGLPAGGEAVQRDDGLSFRVYRRGRATLAFWQEGEVICFLASSRLPPAELTALAFAKAERV